ncbi:GntR family transcriptional regulator [Pseudonocardia spinosispora]|uniref:GntR family transcriptional regulator n=1 Tax=Pseudonocardia spinosispora TaxID=103441 RepID=UPI0003F89567|nr:GntR family transcriptional regulator [Pseudonocardia spinosispora]
MASDEGSPVDAGSSAQRAYLEIVNRLASGEFAPGTWLRERSLAESMGMSRTPVREAFGKLSSEGLVRLERNRGAQVLGWSRDQINEIYGLRATVEGYVAAVAAEKIDDAAIDKLEANLAAYEAVVNAPDCSRQQAATLNNEFHALILGATRNDQLLFLLNGVLGLPLVSRTFLRYTDADLRRSVEHHRDILDALRHRDAVTAEMLMKVHIRTAQRAVLRYEQLDSESPAS